jgi:hypothetical protein
VIVFFRSHFHRRTPVPVRYRKRYGEYMPALNIEYTEEELAAIRAAAAADGKSGNS